MTDRVRFDGLLVIGAGLAGLSAALAAAPRAVMVLSAAPLGEGCSSAWAQGGMAAALDPGDHPSFHAADTLKAGAGLCDPAAVALLTEEGPEAVRRLAALGAPFDRRSDGGFAQSLEAAHSHARVARVGGDGAGRAIMAAVITKVRASSHVEIREAARVRALLTDGDGRVRGALVDHAGRLTEIIAPATILASGGLGGLYAVTTNPAAVLGDGLALGGLAGAEILDPEFIQFHPTAIDIGADPAPLATEALRGEGAVLVNADGRAFMAGYHSEQDLAPRDVVARAIASERAAGRATWLDCRAALGRQFADRFPAVFSACMAAGLDPRIDPIPVVPAAHYHMGGLATDLWGRTSLEHLFAAGECAATGVHGANRLASNSLVEAAVFGARAGLAARVAIDPATRPVRSRASPDLPPDALTALRRRMTREAGVVRDGASLLALSEGLAAMETAHGAALPLVAAGLVANAALARRESRGAHFRVDFPDLAEQAVHSRRRLVAEPAAEPRAA